MNEYPTQLQWQSIVEQDRREAGYGRRRRTRCFGRWLFFAADWSLSLTIVAYFDRAWPNRASRRELEHLFTSAQPGELSRCFVLSYRAKPYAQPCWLVLEKEPRGRGDPVAGNPIWHMSWGKRPPLGEAGRLLQAKVITADAAKRLGWAGESVAE